MSINPQQLFVSPETAILEAMQVIDRGTVQIALVVDRHQRLLGTLTDGDIRRALVQGKTLDTPCGQVMNQHYRFIHQGSNHTEAVEMMRRKILSHMPVLDEQGHVTQLLLLHELLMPRELPNAVVIMAGGKGERLRPYTEQCPKPMLPINGKPILEILVNQYIASGFRRFYFSVNYLKEQIIDHFGDGSRWGISICYLTEDQPLGTAGSLRLLPESEQETFLVINGDVLSELNPNQLLSFHRDHGADATLCVREHVTTVPFGVVTTKGMELLSLEEKPTSRHLVNAGVYVINPQLLQLLAPHQPTDMPLFLQNAQKAGYRVSVYPLHEYWIDIGRPETLEQAHQEWPGGSGA